MNIGINSNMHTLEYLSDNKFIHLGHFKRFDTFKWTTEVDVFSVFDAFSCTCEK